MPINEEKKKPVDKPGSGDSGTRTGVGGTGGKSAGTKPGGAGQGGVKPLDDDRPPQN